MEDEPHRRRHIYSEEEKEEILREHYDNGMIPKEYISRLDKIEYLYEGIKIKMYPYMEILKICEDAEKCMSRNYVAFRNEYNRGMWMSAQELGYEVRRLFDRIHKIHGTIPECEELINKVCQIMNKWQEKEIREQAKLDRKLEKERRERDREYDAIMGIEREEEDFIEEDLIEEMKKVISEYRHVLLQLSEKNLKMKK